MASQWYDRPFSEFTICEASPSLEEGYKYYEYVHPEGAFLVMRVNEAETEFLFGKGRFSNRAKISYDTYNKLRED